VSRRRRRAGAGRAALGTVGERRRGVLAGLAVAWAASVAPCAADASRVLDLAAPRALRLEGGAPRLPPPLPAAAQQARPQPEPPRPGGPAAPVSPGRAHVAPAAGNVPASPQAGSAVAALGAALPLYSVQVGAFRGPAAARALAARLVARGYDAFVVSVDLGGAAGQGLWNRVRVGRLPDRRTAGELAARLAASEGLSGQVVREGPADRAIDTPGGAR
jgi:cell division septation protein DedD